MYKLCNLRCISCTFTDSNCSICNTDYHFDPEEDFKCINSIELNQIYGENYYLDNNENRYKQCMEGCKTCEDSLGCNNCKENHYFTQGEPRLCLSFNGYYLDLSEKIYKKCNSRCSTCIGSGNNDNSNCTKCKSRGRGQVDHHFDPVIDGHCITESELHSKYGVSYYLEQGDVDRYKPCNSVCKECRDPVKCTSCDNHIYFFREDDTNYCYNETIIEQGYYLDKSQNKYRKCNYRCSTCNMTGNDANSNCQTCANGYHFHPDIKGHCIVLMN